jgi:hypothetical protein
VKAVEDETAALRRLLPLCSWCRRIRSDDGKWELIEHYLKKKADTDVTHGVCPECYEKQLRSY